MASKFGLTGDKSLFDPEGNSKMQEFVGNTYSQESSTEVTSKQRSTGMKLRYLIAKKRGRVKKF